LAIDGEQGEDGMEWFRYHERAQEDEERAGKNLQIYELRRRAEASI
jgi:hypothetical protein